MDRLKEVRACSPPQTQHFDPLGTDPCKGSRALQPLPPLLHSSLLFVRLFVRPLSARRSPLPSVRPPVPLVPPQLLLLLSLTQSLERQLRAALVPLVALRFRLLLLSLRGFLLVAWAKVRAGGKPPHGVGSVAVLRVGHGEHRVHAQKGLPCRLRKVHQGAQGPRQCLGRVEIDELRFLTSPLVGCVVHCATSVALGLSCGLKSRVVRGLQEPPGRAYASSWV